MGIALNTWIAFRSITIFTMFILPIHEHGWSFTFCRLLQSLSLMAYSSPCKEYLHLLLSLFLGFFEAIENGIVSYIFSQSVCYWCIEKLLIFVS
jgi:hypothetical protein